MNCSRWLVRVLLPLLLVAPTLPAGASPRPVSEKHLREIRVLVAEAIEAIRVNSIDARKLAIHKLERVTELDPGNADYQLLLGRCYLSAGYVRASRKRFERVVALSPGDAIGHYGLGQVWRRDWRKFLDPQSLDRAVAELASATQLDSSLVDAWLMLVSLRLEAHDTTGAVAAAAGAMMAGPDRPESHMAVALTAWRMGIVDQADTEFRIALPRLPSNVRDRFEDIAPLASEADTAFYNHLPRSQRTEYARRFWAEHDPDLASPENEAQLEYWARVAQAYFLFYDAKHQQWDERGEVYVRYGPPERLEYNPMDAQRYSMVGDSQFLYPMNVLVWDYPSLGMTVTFQDRVLTEYYLLPTSRSEDMDPRPDAAALARLDVVGTHELRGVFPTRPPRTTPVRVDGEVARFQGPAGPRYYAALEAESSPGDSLRAQIVVVDSTEREVLRTTSPLSPSACEAGRFRVADFAGELPPGRYRVGLSVRAGTRRGSVRIPFTVPKPDSELSLSQVVVTCGTPLVLGQSVRLDPNPLARVPAGEPLTAYFEIYHLDADAHGEGRFQYVYTVKSADRDERVWLQRALSPRASGPSMEASRVETNYGSIRRQFVSEPVQSLPAGRYRLDIVVHDLVSGQDAKGSAEFERLPAAP